MSDIEQLFIPIADPREAESLLAEGAKTIAGATIWTKNQKNVLRTHLLPAPLSQMKHHIFLWTPRNDEAKALESELTNEEDVSCYVNIALTRANIFFKAKLSEIESDSLKFDRPAVLYKIQRRQSFRLPIPDGYIVRVEFKDPDLPLRQISHKIYDVSTGGLSFLVSHGSESSYQVGSCIRDMKFKVRSKEIIVDGEVRYIKDMTLHPKMNGFKIGIQFIGLSAAGNQLISTYVFEESRKYFSKFF